MHEMEEVKAELDKIKEIKKSLISAVELTVAKGVFSQEVDAKELGEVVDMIKDLAETDRNCWEACYYKTVVKAMKEGGSEDEEERMGYNRNRYANGRYAPSGSGRSGYMDRMPPIYYDDSMPMGYSRGGNNGNSGGSYQGSGSGNNGGSNYGNSGSSGYSRTQTGNQFGVAYDDYMDARRHYHDSKSPDDKNHMDKKALEHVNGSVMTLREIWKDADPSVQKEVKTAIKKLAEEFEH